MLKFSDGYGRKPGMLRALASICGVITAASISDQRGIHIPHAITISGRCAIFQTAHTQTSMDDHRMVVLGNSTYDIRSFL